MDTASLQTSQNWIRLIMAAVATTLIHFVLTIVLGENNPFGLWMSVVVSALVATVGLDVVAFHPVNLGQIDYCVGTFLICVIICPVALILPVPFLPLVALLPLLYIISSVLMAVYTEEAAGRTRAAQGGYATRPAGA